MKLIDLLSVIDDSAMVDGSAMVVVVDSLNNELSRYDSKNSIDYMYNDCDIVTIYHQQDAIVIMINL